MNILVKAYIFPLSRAGGSEDPRNGRAIFKKEGIIQLTPQLLGQFFDGGFEFGGIYCRWSTFNPDDLTLEVVAEIHSETRYYLNKLKRLGWKIDSEIAEFWHMPVKK